jgi:hypothetical protein
MQIKKEQLRRQQMIMSALGLYRNTCDGIWGPASIAAKRKWEMSKSFIPGLPNSGLPLSEDSIYPKGVTLDTKNRLFCHTSLTPELIASFAERPVAQPTAIIPEAPSVAPATLVAPAAPIAMLVTSTLEESSAVEVAKDVASDTPAEETPDADAAVNFQRNLQNQNRHNKRR